MINKAVSLGMDSVAVTDHGNIFGAVQLFTKAARVGVRPILGCEMYVAPGDRRERTPARDGQPNAYHLVLLVMNEKAIPFKLSSQRENLESNNVIEDVKTYCSALWRSLRRYLDERFPNSV